VKQSTLLTVTSLLSVLFLSIHLTSDFLNDPGELSLQWILIAALILTVWLWGTLVLAERRTGQVIMLLGSLFALGMPVIHLRRAIGVASTLARPDAFSFIWILLALGVTGLFTAVLSVRGLVTLQRGGPPVVRHH
jgi:hypothetical protein